MYKISRIYAKFKKESHPWKECDVNDISDRISIAQIRDT